MDYHYPVMLKEVEKYVASQLERTSGGITIFDGTLGHAGHLIYLMKDFGENIDTYVATDADQSMFSVARERIQLEIPEWVHKLQLVNDSYVTLFDISQQLGRKYDIVFLDLGVNLRHFKQHERGFSIKGEGELDMRYNQNEEKIEENGGKLGKVENGSEKYPDITAADVLNTYTEKQLVDMFVLNSEISLPTSTKIAEEIVRMRKNKPRKTSTELNKLTMKLNYSARVAAIVFQALRIEVNQEFQSIKLCIERCESCIKDGGILMVLSYHSGEDRIVKELMKKMKEDGTGQIVTKNAIPPTYHEVMKNKPSRSARLRVFRYTGKQEQ